MRKKDGNDEASSMLNVSYSPNHLIHYSMSIMYCLKAYKLVWHCWGTEKHEGLGEVGGEGRYMCPNFTAPSGYLSNPEKVSSLEVQGITNIIICYPWTSMIFICAT